MNPSELNHILKDKTPQEIIRLDLRKPRTQVMTTSFGVESALMLHMATGVNKNIPVIFVDTGYNLPETYQFGLELVSMFRLNLKVYKSAISPEEMEDKYGKLWETNNFDYLMMRKLEPLYRAYRELNVRSVISSVRAYQTKIRARFNIVTENPDRIFNIHPILSWTSDMVLEYFEKHKLPYHPLLKKGYGSIGDWHSTEPGPGRDGRWPGTDRTECGIHQVQGGEGI